MACIQILYTIIQMKSWRLVEVQLNLDSGSLQHGPPSLLAPPDVLEADDDGSKGGRLLWGGV